MASRADGLEDAYHRATSAAEQGHWQEVRRLLEPLRDVVQSRREPVLLLARAYAALHHPARALEYLERALALEVAAGNEPGEVEAMNLLGIVRFETGDLAGAEAAFGHALAVAERLDDTLRRAQIHNNLGNLRNLQEDAHGARTHYREALHLFCALGSAVGEAQTLHNLGIAHRDLGLDADAEQYFARAMRTADVAGHTQLVALSTAARAELVLKRGDAGAAEAMARAALVLFDVNANLLGVADVHRLLGILARRKGDFAGARAHLDRALEYCRLHENPLVEAETRLERGVLLQQAGEAQAAQADLAAAMATFERLHATRQAERARQLAGNP